MDMSDKKPEGLYVLTSWNIKPGKLEEFKAVIAKMVDAIEENDDEAVAIDYYLDVEKSVSYGMEYYLTPESYAEASELVKKWVPELDAASEASNIWMLGDLSDPRVQNVLQGWEYDHGEWFFGFRPKVVSEGELPPA